MAESRIVEELGAGRVEAFPLPTDEVFLLKLLQDLFQDHWSEIVFGTLIQGAVFEIRAPAPPTRFGIHDGYLTVDYGTWHFHLCIGSHKGTRTRPIAPELASYRRTGRAEFFRLLNSDNSPRSWGLRLFNGHEEQQLTVFLPNPFLGENDRILKTPDWDRLALWDVLRERYLGLEPDPRDRSGTRFNCGGH